MPSLENFTSISGKYYVLHSVYMRTNCHAGHIPEAEKSVCTCRHSSIIYNNTMEPLPQISKALLYSPLYNHMTYLGSTVKPILTRPSDRHLNRP